MGRQPGQKYSNSVSFRLDDEAMGQLEALAEQEQRPVAMMARILVNEALKARKGISQPPPGAVRKRKS